MQADLSHCWSHIPHCWKSHVAAHVYVQYFLKTGYSLQRLVILYQGQDIQMLLPVYNYKIQFILSYRMGEFISIQRVNQVL